MKISNISIQQTNIYGEKHYPIKQRLVNPNFKGLPPINKEVATRILGDENLIQKLALYVATVATATFTSIVATADAGKEVKVQPEPDKDMDNLLTTGLESAVEEPTEQKANVEELSEEVTKEETQTLVPETILEEEKNITPENEVVNKPIVQKPPVNYLNKITSDGHVQVLCKISNENKDDLGLQIDELMNTVKAKIGQSNYSWFRKPVPSSLKAEITEELTKKSDLYTQLSTDKILDIMTAIESDKRFQRFTVPAALNLIDKFTNLNSGEPLNTQCKNVLDALTERLTNKLHRYDTQAQVNYIPMMKCLSLSLSVGTTNCANDIKLTLGNKPIKLSFAESPDDGKCLISQVMIKTNKWSKE